MGEITFDRDGLLTKAIADARRDLEDAAIEAEARMVSAYTALNAAIDEAVAAGLAVECGGEPICSLQAPSVRRPPAMAIRKTINVV